MRTCVSRKAVQHSAARTASAEAISQRGTARRLRNHMGVTAIARPVELSPQPLVDLRGVKLSMSRAIQPSSTASTTQRSPSRHAGTSRTATIQHCLGGSCARQRHSHHPGEIPADPPFRPSCSTPPCDRHPAAESPRTLGFWCSATPRHRTTPSRSAATPPGQTPHPGRDLSWPTQRKRIRTDLGEAHAGWR
jgi:hypothetical protein